MSTTRTSYALTVVSIGFLPMIMVLGNSMFIPLLPVIQQTMNLTAAQSGLMLTLFTIPAAIMIPLIGILSDKFGRKRMIIISLLMILVGIFITSCALLFTVKYKWEIMLVGRFFQGVGASGTTLGMAAIGDLFEGEKLSQGLGIIEVFNGIGKVLSPMIGGLFAMFVWHYSFYFYFCFTLTVLICIYFFLYEQRKALPQIFVLKDYVKKMSGLFQREYKWLVPIFLAGGVGLFTLFGMLFFLSFELEQTYGIVSFKKGIYLAAPLSGLTLFSYLTGKKVGTNKNELKRFMIFGMFLFFASFSCLIFFHDLNSLLIYSSIGASALGLFLPSASTAVASSVTNMERGLVVSLYNMARFLGVAFGPVVFGIWMNQVTEMFFFITFLIGVSSVLLMLSWKCIPIFDECLL